MDRAMLKAKEILRRSSNRFLEVAINWMSGEMAAWASAFFLCSSLRRRDNGNLKFESQSLAVLD